MPQRVFNARSLAKFAALVLWALPAYAANHDWVEVRSPNFIVVSNAGAPQARKQAIQFEQIRALFRNSLPYVNAHPSPVITILAVKDESSMGELLPEYWAVKGGVRPSGLFVSQLHQYQIALNLDAHGANPYEVVYHEYYHSVTVPYFDLPVWVAEGMAEFYGHSEIGGKDAGLGLVAPELIYELRSGPLIPFDVLLSVDHNSPYYHEQNKTNIFYAQSWAFTHYLMLGDKGAHRPAFTAYLAALRAGATSQEAAIKAFGSIEKLSVDLQHYIAGMSFAYVGTPAPAKVADSALQVRELSQAETNAYRGGFLAVQGQFKQAESLLAAAVRDDPKLALAQQNMTFLHLARQEWKDAFASASAAIALAPNDGFMRFIRAELAFRRDVTSHEDPQIETDLRQSITTNPDFAPAYDMLATFLAVNNKDLPEALSFAEKARAMEPGTSEYQFSVARVLAQMRRYKEAETLLLAARSRSKDAAFTSRADELLDYLKKATEYDAQRLEQERAYAVYNAERANETPTDKAGVTPDARDTTQEPYDNSRGVELKHRGLSAEGRVTRVTCQGNTMQVTIEVGGVPMVLRAADRTTVNYTDDRPSKSGDIEPCKEMQGRNAAILFRNDNDNKEILSISLRR